jgi:hypothetical protein
MNPILLATALAVNTECSGYYSYIPVDQENEVGFSVEVQATALVVSYLDYSRIFAERQNRPDGVIQIFDQGPSGVNYWLACSGDEAFFVADSDDYHPTARVWRLARTQGDIWAEAKRRGWKLSE